MLKKIKNVIQKTMDEEKLILENLKMENNRAIIQNIQNIEKYIETLKKELSIYFENRALEALELEESLKNLSNKNSFKENKEEAVSIIKSPNIILTKEEEEELEMLLKQEEEEKIISIKPEKKRYVWQRDNVSKLTNIQGRIRRQR